LQRAYCWFEHTRPRLVEIHLWSFASLLRVTQHSRSTIKEEQVRLLPEVSVISVARCWQGSRWQWVPPRIPKSAYGARASKPTTSKYYQSIDYFDEQPVYRMVFRPLSIHLIDRRNAASVGCRVIAICLRKGRSCFPGRLTTSPTKL
jgi:hypothetical protein